MLEVTNEFKMMTPTNKVTEDERKLRFYDLRFLFPSPSTHIVDLWERLQ